MKEQFRAWVPKGGMKVKYQIEKGVYGRWEADQAELLDKIQGIIEDFSEQDIKLTNRQLYYALVSTGAIPNAIEIYKRICTFLTDARYGGFLDWDAIEDRGRVPVMHAEWENIQDLIKDANASYRLPRWSDQGYYLELYTEKQAMESVLKPIAEKYHTYFGYNKGYCSASTMYDLAQRIKAQIENEKQVVILYFGDADPSGCDMPRDITDRLTEFLTQGDNPINPDCFEVKPLALNMEQVRQYKLPPNPAKTTDPRAKKFIEKYGRESWELDALNPKIIRQLAEEGIQEYLDVDKYNAWIKREQNEKKILKEFGDSLAKGEKDDSD